MTVRSLDSAGRLLLAALAFACLSGCLITERTTPPDVPFGEVFPDPGELLTTNAPEELGVRLVQTDIPRTKEHRAQIEALLDSTGSIDTDHLLLLSWAIAPAFEDVPRGTYLVINNVRIEKARMRRGSGATAGAVDALLMRGLDKLTDLDATNAGRLLGRTETPGGLVTLVDRMLADVDDGSTGALHAILRGFDRSFPQSDRAGLSGFFLGGPVETAKEQFVDLLFERGLAEGERERLAIGSFPGDSDRSERIEKRLAELDRVSAERLRGYLDLLDYSASRADVLIAASDRLVERDGETIRGLVALVDYDSQRLEALTALLATGTEPFTTEDLLATLRLLSYGSSRMKLVRDTSKRLRWASTEELVRVLRAFDYGSQRLEMLDTLLPAGPDPLVWDLAVPVLSQFDYVSERLSALDMLRPQMGRAIDPASFRGLFALVNYDSERLGLLRSFSREVRDFPESDRRKLVGKLDYDSSREKAQRILALPRGS